MDAHLWDDQPDITLPNGVQLWRDATLCEAARKRGLSGIRVFAARFPNGERTRIVVDGERVIHENTLLEGVYVLLDAMQLSEEQ